MSSPLPPPKKKRKQRSAPGAPSARSAEGTRPASGPELAGSSTLNPLNPLALEELEEQPEAKQPATQQPGTMTSPQSFRSARLAKIREKQQTQEAPLSMQAQAEDTTGGDVEMVMRRPCDAHSRPVVEPVPAEPVPAMENILCATGYCVAFSLS